MRLALLSILVALAAGCTGSDDPVDNGLDAAWAAFQQGVRAGDADALRALLPPGADDYPAEVSIEVTQDNAALTRDILAASAADLRQGDDGRYYFSKDYEGTEADGERWEVGYSIIFRVDDGRTYLDGFYEIG